MNEQDDLEMFESYSLDDRESNLSLTKGKHECKIICPTIEFLQNAKIVTNVVCPVENCDEKFSHQSALNFHLDKVHKIKPEVLFKIICTIIKKFNKI